MANSYNNCYDIVETSRDASNSSRMGVTFEHAKDIKF